MGIDDSAFWFRLAIVAFASFILVLGMLKILGHDPDKGRRYRIVGMLLLTISAAWSAYEHRFDPFSPRIFVTMVALGYAGYGLHLYHIPEQKINSN